MNSPNPPVPLMVILTLAALTLAYSVLVRMPRSDSNQETAPQPAPGQEEARTGLIEGSTMAADGSHPDDLVVCAQRTIDQVETCTSPGAQPTYALSLEPGQYVVRAHRAAAPEARAFYTDRVACTIPDGCAGKPVVVNVIAGQTLTGIDPTDWQLD